MTQIQIIFFFLAIFSSCERDAPVANDVETNDTTKFIYKTKNVIIVVIDGPRYSETWGDSTHQYIPRMANDLLPKGVLYTGFYNNGGTYTNAGFTAIVTGNYQEIDNTGMQFPQNPSLFQYWLKKTGKEKTAAWLIQSKGKLSVLADCIDEQWKGKYNPSANCGDVRGAYRDDSATYNKAIEILTQHHPPLTLIGFKDPDDIAHQNNWNGYLQEIKNTDEFVFRLWNFLENDSYYKGTTTLFVTNDHGRHLDGVADGFVSHGDGCDGCRHINLFAAGPDFKKNKIIFTQREQIDISATIAELLGFEMPTGKGKVMREMF